MKDTEENIKTLTAREHIRLRAGMYIGKLGDGSQSDDGIYTLIKEVVDNSVYEFIMGAGKQIDIAIDPQSGRVTIRDYGRGIPLKFLKDNVSRYWGARPMMADLKPLYHKGGFYMGGLKVVNFLSSNFTVRSVRDGVARTVEFERGLEISDRTESGISEKTGTFVSYIADPEIFGSYEYNMDFVEQRLHNYIYLNTGLTIKINGQSLVSENGLLGLLNEHIREEPLYPPIHLKGQDIEIVITHGTGYGESCFSFVNGHYTSQGGRHQTAFLKGIAQTIKKFYRKNYNSADIRSALIAAISINVETPYFTNGTKICLCSELMYEKSSPDGPTVRNFIIDYLKEQLGNYPHINQETAEILQKKISENEKERKGLLPHRNPYI